MSEIVRSGFVPAAVFAALFVGAAPANADTTELLDVTAAAGYSSNPFDQIPSRSSVFGRLSGFGLLSWHTPTGTTSLSAYLENTTYLHDYGSKQIFTLAAHTDRAISPAVTVTADVGLSGDFAGQLSNRLLTVPSTPPVTVSGTPLPLTGVPSIYGLDTREYVLNGQVGASIKTSAKGTLSLSASAERLMFAGANHPDDYNIYSASVGYSTQVSPRTSLGGALYLQREDFSGNDYANVINPTATLHSQLSETLTADAGLGVMVVDDHHNGETVRTTTPSFSGSLCDVSSSSRICGRIARDAQSAMGAPIANQSGRAAVTTIASADYFRRLSANETLQASLSGVRYSTTDPVNGSKYNSTYISAVLGYDRKIGHRLAAGVSGGVRKLFQPGPDPSLDLNASVYLRYRIGDLL